MRQLELVETLLEVEHGGGRVRLRLDDRELAELDAGARDRAAADEARPRRQPELVEARDERLDAVFGDVEDHELLVRRRAQARRAVRLDEVGELREGRARDAADDRRGADVEAAVLLPVHADVVAVRERLRRGRVRRAARSRGTRPAAPGGTSRRPTRRAGTSGAPCCAGAGSRSRGRSARRRARHPPPARARRTRPGAPPAAGSSTGRRRPTGRSRCRARGGRPRRTRRR